MLCSPREGNTRSIGGGMPRCSGFAFPQIAACSLDVRVIGQLPAANLPLGDQFEPGPVKVVGFEAAFRRGGLWKQDLKDAPGNTHHTLIFAHADPELDDRAFGVPTGIRRKTEEHVSRERSANVLTLHELVEVSSLSASATAQQVRTGWETERPAVMIRDFRIKGVRSNTNPSHTRQHGVETGGCNV
jgi:hypothetical protein